MYLPLERPMPKYSCSFSFMIAIFYNICGVLQIGLLKVPILLLDKTMMIFLPE
jgi:hypothetical protein